MVFNPFITHGYLSPHYFCDRREETKRLTNLLVNGNNVALMSPRRLGKTGLIHHCFEQEEIKSHYHTFVVDIYATKSLNELVYEMGRTILATLKPRGRKVWEAFLNSISSLRSYISFDINGIPEWSLGLSDVKAPTVTLDEIFNYLEQAERPCLVAIDEFQTIANYPEKQVEATLRTRIQQCKNTWFVFSGSQRHLMSEIFVSPSRPFYQSTMLMSLAPIDRQEYVAFAQRLFEESQKCIEAETVMTVYDRYEGTTWYVQSVLNALFAMTAPGDKCLPDMVERAIELIIEQQSFTYAALLYQLPAKQKEVLVAICKERKATNVTSKTFLSAYHLTASSVQAAIKGLLEKDFITHDLGVYTLYDQFFAQWLMNKQ